MSWTDWAWVALGLVSLAGLTFLGAGWLRRRYRVERSRGSLFEGIPVMESQYVPEGTAFVLADPLSRFQPRDRQSYRIVCHSIEDLLKVSTRDAVRLAVRELKKKGRLR